MEVRTTVAILACAVTAATVVWQSCAREENHLLRTGEPTKIAPLTPNDRFLEAVRQGDLASARGLLGEGADARARDALGSSALLLAARWSDSVELSRFLYDKAPELLDAPDSLGRTPLSWAAQGNRVPVLRFLADRGAGLDVADLVGYTPLLYAVGGGAPDAARFLLEHGAAVNARSRDGDTPLILASAKGNAPLVALLLSAGADKSSRDQEGRSALDRAANDEVRRLLRGG